MALTAQKLIDYMKNEMNIEETIEADSELFSSGLIDSVAMMNVIGFVEETARIEVHPADVTLDNFDTVARIVQLAKNQS
jgi:acyl carrier protein